MGTPNPALATSRQPAFSPVRADAESGRRRDRSAREIERDIADRTERLARNIDELAQRMSPGRLARDGAARVGAGMRTAQGSLRLEVLGALAGAMIGAGVLIWRARRNRR